MEAKDAERAPGERDPSGARPAGTAASPDGATAPSAAAAAVPPASSSSVSPSPSPSPSAAAASSAAPSPSAAPGAAVAPPGSERAWLDGLRRGDPASFDAVFAAYRRRLYGYLVRMTRQRDVAEDLLQETFLRLAQHAKKLADDTRLGAWLFTVAHRLFVSWTRAQGVRAVLAAEVPQREPAGEERSPLDAVAAGQAHAALERAFAELAPPYREVALLVGVEGMQPTEVAQILGQKPEAIRQRLARARAQLAGALGEHAPAAWRQP